MFEIKKMKIIWKFNLNLKKNEKYFYLLAHFYNIYDNKNKTPTSLKWIMQQY